MQLVLDRSREMALWAAERIPEMRGQPPNGTRALGVTDNEGRTVGVVCFHTWEPWNKTIEASVVSIDARWLLARKIWRAIFDYAYKTADVDKIWTRTPSRNTRALRMLKAMGFTYEAVLKKQFGDDDAVISYKFRDAHYG